MSEFFYDLNMCPTLDEIHAVLGKQHTPPRVKAHFAKQRAEEMEHAKRTETIEKTNEIVADDEESCTSESETSGARDRASGRKRSPSREASTDFLDHMSTRDVWDIATLHQLPEAAKLLNVSCTRLKDFCRERGITQWPRRVALCLETLLYFSRTTEEERKTIEGLLADSFHTRFAFSRKTNTLLEKCKRRMYRFRYNRKNRGTRGETG